jgi:hypothetical protein
MRRAPWTVKEFAIVEANPSLSDEKVALLLNGRSPNAVGMIRIGLREDGPAARMFLPKVIRTHLDLPSRAKVTCARCGVKF